MIVVAGLVLPVLTANHASQVITRIQPVAPHAIGALQTRSQTLEAMTLRIACATLATMVLPDPFVPCAKRDNTQISQGVLFAKTVQAVLTLLKAVTHDGIVCAMLDTKVPEMVARPVRSESTRQSEAVGHARSVPCTQQQSKPEVSGRMIVFVLRASQAIRRNSVCRVQQTPTKILRAGEPAIRVRRILCHPRLHLNKALADVMNTILDPIGDPAGFLSVLWGKNWYMSTTMEPANSTLRAGQASQ